MPPTSLAAGTSQLQTQLSALDPNSPHYAVEVVERLLAFGRAEQVSDLHLQPTPAGIDVRARLDGVLQPVAQLPARSAANCIARLKVLAGLLTYRTDIPQEGRLPATAGELELRVSTFPTIHGEKAVIRFFAGAKDLLWLDDLGFPADLLENLRRLLAETSGALFVTGPAGAGKTTTLYAAMRELAQSSDGGRSLASLEDPVEVAVPGVAQSQVSEGGEFDLATGLRFLMRQDPEVIMVGEIRDRATAEAALQASLTGHLVLSSFHAGSAAGGLSRLADMGIPPYVLRSGVLGVLSQRLVRRLCSCAVETTDPDARLGLHVDKAWTPKGCSLCRETGYSGRLVIAELLMVNHPTVAAAILERADSSRLEQAALASGMRSRWERAREAVAAGATSPSEIRRIFGFGDDQRLQS